MFPLSNWTELDIWQYIEDQELELPPIYFAHRRLVFRRTGMLLAVGPWTKPRDGVAGEQTIRDDGALPDCRGHDLHSSRRVDGQDAGGDHRRDLGDKGERAGGDARRRPLLGRRHGGPQAGGLLLMELLRFATGGSVDDGKSTLIGRLLYDTKQIFEDQLEAVERTSLSRGDEYVNLALLTDGLRAEREQGITIDVAYRYFSTPKRRFIIADTPGHTQHTRNMVTGCSTSDLVLLLIDARAGATEQTRRHATIASLLGIHHLVLCVNKMDLVDYSRARFEEIREEFTGFAQRLEVHDLTCIPISALTGDNVVERSTHMSWYGGPSLLDHLEGVHIGSDRNLIDLRFPVQLVIRPISSEHHDFRGYGGMVASGVLEVGDEVIVLPSGFSSRVANIDGPDGSLQEAFPPQSVVVRLEDDLDISRGDMICRRNNRPNVGQDVSAMVCWMAAEPLREGSMYAIKHTTRWARAMVRSLQYRLDVNTLHRDMEAGELQLNDIGRIHLRTTTPLLFDEYRHNRPTGSFVLVNEQTNATVAAGMLLRPQN